MCWASTAGAVDGTYTGAVDGTYTGGTTQIKRNGTWNMPVLRTTTQKITIGARLDREMQSPVTNECGSMSTLFIIEVNMNGNLILYKLCHYKEVK